MVVGGSQQETLDPGFVLLGIRQQGVPVILRELVLPGGFNLVSPASQIRHDPHHQTSLSSNHYNVDLVGNKDYNFQRKLLKTHLKVGYVSMYVYYYCNNAIYLVIFVHTEYEVHFEIMRRCTL
ncbi:unnamed protein product [Schistosoma margrebowiei]|uniref:Uncharacterized protein n=1 Tax=Schistosoma margrebowiei TaxID=48269 RepID=A0A183LA40_9TREM|nr:unnamed protein product [Schistosoma margrebowiei]